MNTRENDIWAGAIRVGDMPLEVVCAGAAPGGWPAGARAHVSACIEAFLEGPPAAGVAVLSPAPGHERAYRAVAAALAADDMVGLVSVEGAGEFRLRSLGEALVAEWGRAESPEDARGFSETELARALGSLRALPRRLPHRGAADGGPGAGGAEVLDFLQARRARGR